jgi:hypothetical protein
VIELRVHGVMGIAPAALVSAVAAVDVAGDGVGRIVQPADRLLRPAPGPMLRAEGQSIPRTVEGYAWDRMTSGGATKAVWALLFPFSLANVAHWMLPPIPSGHRAGRLLGLANRALLRLAAALLTMLLVGQVAVVSIDLLAAQCLAPGAACLAGPVPDWLRETALFRPLVGLVPVLLVVYLLHRISCVAWARPEHDNPPPTPPHRRVHLPGSNLVGDPDTPTLRVLHLVTALATVALLPLGGPVTVPDGRLDTVLWVSALALLGIGLAGVALLDDPTGATPHRAGAWLRTALGPWPRRVLLGLAVVVLFAAGLSRSDPTAVTGTNTTIEAVAAGIVVLVVLHGVLLIPAARVARPEWRGRPKELRPWAGGWMSAPVLALAALLGGGFGAGLAIAVRQLLGNDALTLPDGYAPVTQLWGAGAALGALVALGAAGYLLVRLRSTRQRHDEGMVPLLHAGRPDDAAAARRAWLRAGWQRRHFHQLVLAGAGVLSAGAAYAILLRLTGFDTPSWLDPLSAIGVLTLGVLAGALLRAVYNAARAPEAGRHLGIVADLASFWPRESHPIVPPCYAMKVAPELAARAAHHLADPHTRVVLTGTSQGSLIVAVAAARLLDSLNEPERRRLGLLTVGSQLQWAYSRAFPSVLPHAAMSSLAGELGTRWRSLCRGTDALGGAVTTWQRQPLDDSLLGLGYRPDGTNGALSAAVEGPTGALVLGLDHWLPDPPRGPFEGRRWTAGVQTHANYPADPEWDRAVAMAAGLDPAEPAPLSLFPLPKPR